MKTTSDAHVLLSPCKGCNGYEVVIGGWNNRKSIIREKKQGGDKGVVEVGLVREEELGYKILSSFQTTGILSDKEYRTFWIKTTSGTISVGKGGETDPFMSHSLKRQEDQINFVAFSSWTGHTGKWEILPHHLQFTTKNYNYNPLKYYSTSSVINPEAGILS